MSNEGPFSAAIETLSPLAGRPEIARAIRVLGAAGKVDKVSELATLAAIRTELNLRPFVHRNIDESVRRVRALLEVLPPKEAKLESIFLKDDPDEVGPGERRTGREIKDIAAMILQEAGKEEGK